MVCTARGCACGRPIVIRIVNGKRTPILDASGRRPVRFNGARPREAGKGGLPAGQESLHQRRAQGLRMCSEGPPRSGPEGPPESTEAAPVDFVAPGACNLLLAGYAHWHLVTTTRQPAPRQRPGLSTERNHAERHKILRSGSVL